MVEVYRATTYMHKTNLNITKRFSLAFLLCLVAIPIYAQKADTLHRELTVVSEHSLNISAQTPLDSRFQFDKPKVTRLKPTMPQPTGDYTPEVKIPRNPALSSIAGKSQYTPKHAYITLEGGYTPNVNVEAGGYIPFGDKVSLHAIGGYKYLQNGWKRTFQITRQKGFAAIQLTSQTDVCNWNIGGNYQFDSEKSIEAVQSKLNPEYLYKNHIGSFGGNIQWNDDSYKAYIKGSGDFSQINNWNGAFAGANDYAGGGIKGGYEQLFGNYFLLGGIIEASIEHGKSEIYGPVDLKSTNPAPNGFMHREILKPYIGFLLPTQEEGSYIKVGAAIGMYMGSGTYQILGKNEIRHFLWYPYIDARIKLNKLVELYAQSSGDISRSTNYLNNINTPYVTPGFLRSPEITLWKAQIGSKFLLNSNVSMSVSGGYKRVANKNILSSLSVENTLYPIYKPSVVVGNTDVAFVNVNAQFEMFRWLSLNSDVSYNHFALANKNKPYGLIPWEVRASLELRPIYNLSIYANLYAGLGTTFENPNRDKVSDFKAQLIQYSIGSSYRVNKYFVLHATLENLLLSNIQYPYGIPSAIPNVLSIGLSVIL